MRRTRVVSIVTRGFAFTTCRKSARLLAVANCSRSLASSSALIPLDVVLLDERSNGCLISVSHKPSLFRNLLRRAACLSALRDFMSAPAAMSDILLFAMKRPTCIICKANRDEHRKSMDSVRIFQRTDCFSINNSLDVLISDPIAESDTPDWYVCCYNDYCCMVSVYNAWLNGVRLGYDCIVGVSIHRKHRVFFVFCTMQHELKRKSRDLSILLFGTHIDMADEITITNHAHHYLTFNFWKIICCNSLFFSSGPSKTNFLSF